MAKYQKFEELPAWQEAARLYNAVLDVLEAPGCPFSPGFRNQLDRAALFHFRRQMPLPLHRPGFDGPSPRRE
ncbi:MAG: hypothetical protein WCS99_15290, partial [Limisphaerales bacterium]